MDKQAQNRRERFGLVGAICGSLLMGLPVSAMPQMETEKLLAQINPRPGIFQEAPYNRSNTATPVPSQPSTPAIQAPLPEEQQAPAATVAPVQGKLSVRLVNKTGANISYQVIGDTNQRSLQGKSDVMLTGLATPATITFKRDDGGLLSATAQPASEPGMVEATLTETTDLGMDRSTMRIQNTGAVFFN
jgi:hypothetical protein